MNSPLKDYKVVNISKPMEHSPSDEIDLIDLFRILWKRKVFITSFVLLCTLAAFLVCTFLLTPIYRAEATLQATDSSRTVISSFLNSTNLKRRLIEKYELLPVLYSDIWNPASGEWNIKNPVDTPTIKSALSEKKLPFEVQGDLRFIWEGPNPDFNERMLLAVIEELRFYLNNEYITNAQIHISFLENGIAPFANIVETHLEEIFSENVVTTRIDLIGEYSKIQSTISELRALNQSSRRFEVISEPIAAAAPVFPKTTLIVALTFFASGMLAVFSVFLVHALRNVQEK